MVVVLRSSADSSNRNRAQSSRCHSRGSGNPVSVKRVRIDKPGPHSVLRVGDCADPSPAAGEVLIKVAACGVNYADAIIRMGLYASARELHGYPITPGFEVSGVVSALGAGVDEYSIGDRVIGVTLFNGYSSQIALPCDRVFRVPDSIDLVAAAGIPTVFLTAWFMVHQQLVIQPGERWLVHSAAGGVGSALVQLGVLAGCEVVAVVGSTHKVAHAQAMGAQQVIDKSQGALWSRVRSLSPDGYDAIFDANGVSTLADSYAHLAPAGRLLIYGFHSMLPHNGKLNWLRLAWHWLRTPRFNPLNMTQANRSVLACNLSFLSGHSERLRLGMLWLLQQFEAGLLRPLSVETHAMQDVIAAHQRIESGQTLGKLVLLPD